jgi:hypothetical protein
MSIFFQSYCSTFAAENDNVIMKLLSHIISLTLPDTTPLQVSALLNLGLTYVQQGFNKVFHKEQKIETPCAQLQPCM